MNREIKFRAWTGHEMTDDVVCGKFGNFYVNPSNNGLDEKDSACISPFNTKYPYSVHVMQFTGRKDKNGRDIYEGDILHERFEDEAEPNGFGETFIEVTFQESSFGWIGETTGNFYSFSTDPLDDIVVVGNVYENPELLSSSQNHTKK